MTDSKNLTTSGKGRVTQEMDADGEEQKDDEGGRERYGRELTQTETAETPLQGEA